MQKRNTIEKIIKRLGDKEKQNIEFKITCKALQEEDSDTEDNSVITLKVGNKQNKTMNCKKKRKKWN